MSEKSTGQKPLQNRCVVVTRPVHQAKPLKTKLEAAGAEVILFPLIQIDSPSDLTLANKKLQSIESYDLLIFISPNAVEQSLKLISRKQISHSRIAAIGKKTAAALKQSKIEPDIFPSQMFNSEALLALPEMQNFTAQTDPDGSNKTVHKIAIIRGENGREFLANSLRQRGAVVDYIDVYRRICPQHNCDMLEQLWDKGKLDIILLTSGTSITNLFALCDAKQTWINQITLLLGSSRMQENIPASFKGKLILADDPSDETLLNKLIADVTEQSRWMSNN